MVQQIDEQRSHFEHQLNIIGSRSAFVPRNRLVADATVAHVVQEDRVPRQHMHRPNGQKNALEIMGEKEGDNN